METCLPWITGARVLSGDFHFFSAGDYGGVSLGREDTAYWQIAVLPFLISDNITIIKLHKGIEAK